VQKRVWVRSGVVEELDARQTRLLDLVLERIRFYYASLYRTAPRYQYPLSLARLMKLCHRGGQTVALAIKYLANTVPEGSSETPPIYYDRVASARNRTHRPYRIFLRQKSD
jgi:hypothetical protein